METLELRVMKQQEQAAEVLAFLRTHPRVVRLRSVHPLDCDPQAAHIQARQTTGHGSMLAFEVAGGRKAAFAVLDALQTVRLAVSLGSTESLATHPASTTHSAIPAEDRERLGISEGMIRLSVGLEPVEELLADLGRALDALG
jgi:methionine-gamma-lyase